MKRIRLCFLGSIYAVGAVGILSCSDAPRTAGDPTSQPTFTDTSYSRNELGEIEVHVRTVSAEYRAIQKQYKDKRVVAKLQREMLYGKLEEGTAAAEVSCDDPDCMWLNTGEEQDGDRICFKGDILNPLGNGFAENILSWWAGYEFGALHDDGHPFGQDCNWNWLCSFSEWERVDFAPWRPDDQTACIYGWQCPSGVCDGGFCSCSSTYPCPGSNNVCEGICYNQNCGPAATHVNLGGYCLSSP